MTTKTVRFYRPQLVHDDGSSEELDAGFWSDVHDRIGQMSQSARMVRHRGSSLFGEVGTGVARAYRYIRVGRVRYRADWPETIDQAGQLGELELTGLDIFEGAFVVPFGTETNVAIMGPVRGQLSTTAIEHWLGQVLGLVPAGLSLTLAPLMDPTLTRKLAESEGVTRLEVRLPKDAVPVLPTGSQVTDAFNQAKAVAEDQLNVELSFSFGQQRPTSGLAGQLKQAAQAIADSGAADRVDVGLMVPNADGDGYHVEAHNLVRDNVAVRVDFNVADDSRLDIEMVLDRMHEAIEDYRAR